MTTNTITDLTAFDEMLPIGNRVWLADFMGEDDVINRFGTASLGIGSHASLIWEEIPNIVAVIDSSSVFPKFYYATETFHAQKVITKSVTISKTKESYDFKLPPKRTYEVKLKIQSWEKATPKIIV